MQTTVVLREPADFGEGLVTHVVFHDAKFHVDQSHDLYVSKDTAGGRDPLGNVAAFRDGEWRNVIRGTLSKSVPSMDVDPS